ncbi:glycosyltransferase [Planktomarina temperata]|nr:glycosyltransferase [Planktomarina temperata]
MDLTICVPCFNDSKNVDKLLFSIYSSDTDNLKYEILVCDGQSDDGIEEIVLSWESRLPVRLISTSPRASASRNINAGVECAKGAVFCRIDSHCLVTEKFIKLGLKEFNLRRNEFSALGPSVSVIGSKDNFVSNTISKLYMSPFLLGPSKFKRSVFYKNYSGEIGNIYLGFYLTEDVKELRFCENIQRKQDIEFLSRLRKKRGVGFYNSSAVEVKYILKQDSIFALINRCVKQGDLLFQSVGVSRFVHFLPLLCVLLFIGIVMTNFSSVPYVCGAYLICSFCFGFLECRSILGSLLAVFLFPCVHLSYVVGNGIGLFNRLSR